MFSLVCIHFHLSLLLILAVAVTDMKSNLLQLIMGHKIDNIRSHNRPCWLYVTLAFMELVYVVLLVYDAWVKGGLQIQQDDGFCANYFGFQFVKLHPLHLLDMILELKF